MRIVMAELLRSRRRAEEFARAVDAAAVDAAAVGAVEDRDSAWGEPRVEPPLAPLVRLTLALGALPVVTPDAQFRADLRSGLLAAAARDLAPAALDPGVQPQRPAPGVGPGSARGRRRLAAAATALVLAGGVSGVAAASQQALPGDALYPIKRGLESIEMALAGSERAAGRELLERAETRLGEVEGMLARGVDDVRDRNDLTHVLLNFAADTGRGGETLVDSYRRDDTTDDLVEVRTFTAAAAERLADLADGVPPESRPALLEAVQVVEAVDSMALQACPSCTAALPPLQVEAQLMALLGIDASASPQTAGPPADGTSRRSAGRAGSGRPDTDAVAGARQTSGGSGLPGAEPTGEVAINSNGVVEELLQPGGGKTADDGGVLSSDGPVLGDGGLAGTKGPVLGDDGVLGTDGPVLGDDGVLGTDGPVLGDDGLVGTDGPLLGDEGVLGGNGPVLGDEGLTASLD